MGNDEYNNDKIFTFLVICFFKDYRQIYKPLTHILGRYVKYKKLHALFFFLENALFILFYFHFFFILEHLRSVRTNK